MYKVTILYPANEDNWFDLEYYLQTHVPLSRSIFGDSLKGLAIEEAQNKESPYKIIGHLFFEDYQDFYRKFIPNKDLLEEDAKNYTDINAEVQISKVIVWEHFE